MGTILVILWIAGVYLGIGFLFGVAFVARGVERIDPAAKGARWHFRLLILPGCAAMWPVLLKRWIRGEQPPGPGDPRVPAVERRRATQHVFWPIVGPALLAWFIWMMASRPAMGPAATDAAAAEAGGPVP